MIVVSEMPTLYMVVGTTSHSCEQYRETINTITKIAEAVLTSNDNLCFGAKLRKIGIPLHIPVLLC